MRVIIDLSSCQEDSGNARIIDFVEAMLRTSGDHDIYLAVDARHMASAESLRQRLRVRLKPAHFLSFVSPESGTLRLNIRSQSATSAAIKNMAFQALLGDVIFEIDPPADSISMKSDDSDPCAPMRVCLLTRPLLAVSAEGSFLRRAFDLFLFAGDAVRRSACETFGLNDDQLIDIGDSFDPTVVWKSIERLSHARTRKLYYSPVRIAIVSPAVDAEKNLATLRAQFPDPVAIDLFVEADTCVNTVTLQPDIEIYSHDELPNRCDDYAAVLFVMANRADHAFMLPTIEQVPGILLLHDIDLRAPFRGLASTFHGADLIAQETLYCGGLASLRAARMDDNQADSPLLVRRLIELADGVLATADIASKIKASNRASAWLPPITTALSDLLVNIDNRKRAFRQLVDSLEGVKPGDRLLDLIASQAASNANWRRQPRLLVDVTQLAASNARSGIQRVVRNIVRELGSAAALDRPFELVQLADGKLCRANGIAASIFEIDLATLPEQDISIHPGDTLLMLDSSWEQYQDFTPVFQAVRQMGGTIVTVVYDLIPLLMPELCSPGLTAIFQNWFRLAVDHSDQLLCISNAVANEVRTQLRDRGIARQIEVGQWRLGADIAITPDESTVRPQVRALAGEQGSPIFLMVGTIEPRKGHDFALDAFELLWRSGNDARLCIAGSIGWMVNDTMKRIRQHPELNRRLFFIEQFTDAEIALCYQSSAALIAASIAEGFGLPIVEAAIHGVPVIASDIPVFREVGGDRAVYFSRADSRNLSDAILDFLITRCDGPEVGQMAIVTWRESVVALLGAIDCKRM